MTLRPLKLPFQFAALALSYLFVLAFVEGFGLLFYFEWRDLSLAPLVSDGVSVGHLLRFAGVHPEAALVAVGLAVLAGVLVVTGDSGGSGRHRHGGGFGHGGGFDDDAGGHGGDGGGGGGGGGGE